MAKEEFLERHVGRRRVKDDAGRRAERFESRSKGVERTPVGSRRCRVDRDLARLARLAVDEQEIASERRLGFLCCGEPGYLCYFRGRRSFDPYALPVQ